MKINAVLEKELRISSRAYKTMVSMLVINIFLAGISLLVFGFMVSNASYSGSIDYSSMIDLYIVIASIEFGVFSLVIPAITASTISSEREKQTLEMLLTTKMNTKQIIFGKMCSALCSMMLYLVATLPILSLAFAFGGVNLWDMFLFILVMLVTAYFVGSVGIFCSTIIKKTTGATVLAYTGLIIVYATPFIILLVVYYIIMMQYTFSNSITATMPDTSVLIYILLFDPVVTFVDMICVQVGNQNYIDRVLSDISNAGNNFIFNNWVVISMIIQIILGSLILFASSKILNPVKKVKRSVAYNSAINNTYNNLTESNNITESNNSTDIIDNVESTDNIEDSGLK